MKPQITLRKVLLFFIIALLVFVARPVGFLLHIYYKDNKPAHTQRTGYTNDASNLNETKISTIVKVLEKPSEATVQIAELIKQTKTTGKRTSYLTRQRIA